MNASTLVQKNWHYCNILRDDGLSYGDYVEQLTFLLFLKMADEKTRSPFNQRPIIEVPWNWPELLERDADDLEVHYRHTLEALGKADGMIGVIFRKAQNKIQDPAKLKRLSVDQIDKEDWHSYSVEKLLACDKASLDLFWLKDDSLSDSDNLPAPEIIAAEIIEDLQAALDQLKELEADLQPSAET